MATDFLRFHQGDEPTSDHVDLAALARCYHNRSGLPALLYVDGRNVSPAEYLESLATNGKGTCPAGVLSLLDFVPHHASVATVARLAERWKCSTTHVYRLIRQGKLDAFRHGRRLLLVRGEVVQAHERSRLAEVVTAEEQAKRDAAERRMQEALNEGRLQRRIERRALRVTPV